MRFNGIAEINWATVSHAYAPLNCESPLGISTHLEARLGCEDGRGHYPGHLGGAGNTLRERMLA